MRNRKTNRNARPARWRGPGRTIPAAGGIVLAALLAAGCGSQHAAAGGSVKACTAVSVAAIRHGVAITSLPAACSGLTRSQLSSAATAAVAAVTGPMHGKTLMRARMRDLRPLLLHLAPGSAIAPGLSASALPGRGGLPLDIAALAGWLITVALGTVLMARWIARGGLRRRGGARGKRPVMNFAHLGAAAAGLTVWVLYVATGLSALAWAACILLMPVTGLGMAVLFGRPERPPAPPVAAPAGDGGAAGAAAPAAAPAGTATGTAVATAVAADPAGGGQPTAHRTVPLVLAAHIALAFTTVLLTVLASISAL